MSSTREILDRVYQAKGDDEMRALYDEWADAYDSDLASSGYLTPGRVAEALATHASDRDIRIMDYGCGTGLSGGALAQAGFTSIDGADLSQGMLDVAAKLGVYRSLSLVEPNAAVGEELSQYGAITAVGVISKGAAPAEVYPQLLDVMASGALLALSMNDLSMADPEYGALIPDSVAAGKVHILSENYGPHLTQYGANSGSTVFVLERLR